MLGSKEEKSAQYIVLDIIVNNVAMILYNWWIQTVNIAGLLIMSL